MRPFRLLAFVAAGYSVPAVAAPELAPLFQGNGVLQCDKPVPVWGRAAPGEHLTVSFAGQKVGAKAAPDGRWIAVLAPLAANPLGADLTVTGNSTFTAHGIVVGEVWLCAGGSSMAASLEGGATAEIGTARYALIRHFRVPAAPTGTDRGDWKAYSPESASQFTAVGYFFARDLVSRLGVPIGIVDSSSARSTLEAWMSPAALAAFPATRRQAGSAPSGPQEPSAPSGLFSAMIQPLLPYAIRGVLWYQGEADVGRASDYSVRFPAMITAWRSHFGEGDFPFFWVQIAGPNPPSVSAEDRWARLREAQSAALSLPATGQAVASDVGDAGRLEIARRLALIAKATVYSIPVDYSGPTFSGSSVEGAAIRVHFNFAGEGLTASGKPLQSFEIAGADHVFHVAGATIHGDTVLVRSPVVRQPVAVRYAWRGSAEGNLYNGAGLPAPPFRSDDW
jgi:sialate O-acetylesterase